MLFARCIWSRTSRLVAEPESSRFVSTAAIMPWLDPGSNKLHLW